MPSRLMNRTPGAASSTVAGTGARCTMSASAAASDSPAMTSLPLVACNRSVVMPASRSTCSSAAEVRLESVMTIFGPASTCLRLLHPGDDLRLGDPLGGILDVSLHRALGGALVAGRDDVEQFLVAVRVHAQLVRRESGCRRAVEVAGAAAHLRRELDEQGVVGQLPQPLVELLVEFVNADKVTLLRGERHLADDRLQPGVRLGRETALQPAHDELLEHDTHARDLFHHPRGEARDPRATARETYDQALLGQPGQCFPQRDVTDAELMRETPLHEALAGRVHPAGDRGPQAVDDSIRQALIGQRLVGVHAARYRWMTRPGLGVRSTMRCKPSTTSPTASRCTGSWALARTSSVAGPTHDSCSATSSKPLVTSSRLTTPSSSWRTLGLTFTSAPGTSLVSSPPLAARRFQHMVAVATHRPHRCRRAEARESARPTRNIRRPIQRHACGTRAARIDRRRAAAAAGSMTRPPPGWCGRRW